MNVAVPAFQHSAIFGQRASSHTVCNAFDRIMVLSCAYVSPPGAFTLSHSGRRLVGNSVGKTGNSKMPVVCVSIAMIFSSNELQIYQIAIEDALNSLH
jgi:hypothetical protein